MKAYKKKKYGITKDGREATQYTLTNDKGMYVSVIDYGCRIREICVPDRDGQLVNVSLCFTGLEKYEGGGCYGALIGRFANRIKNAKFKIDGVEYELPHNDHHNYIHGNFEHTMFDAEASDDKIVFRYTSPDGEFGFPGTVELTATYAFTEDGALELTYEATTDAPTVINITNHNYFNLNGLPENGAAVKPSDNNVFNHLLTIPAETYLESDDVFMVTGKEIPVSADYHDHRTEKVLSTELYDQNYCLGRAGEMKLAATLKSPATGIVMETLTTQPGIQVYTGAKKAIALETQHYPDGPNHPEWPSTLLRPGEVYKEKTIYRFGTC